MNVIDISFILTIIILSPSPASDNSNYFLKKGAKIHLKKKGLKKGSQNPDHESEV